MITLAQSISTKDLTAALLPLSSDILEKISSSKKLRIKIDAIWNENEKDDAKTFEATKAIFEVLFLEYSQTPSK